MCVFMYCSCSNKSQQLEQCSLTSKVYRMAGNIGAELYVVVGEKKPVSQNLIRQYNFIV